MSEVFLLDGKAYRVDVLSLNRKFAIQETGIGGRTQDGGLYRDLLGTYYNYSMTVGPRDGDMAEMDALWEAVSAPRVSHECRFPYGQKTLTQKMYVTAGEQRLRRAVPGKNHWDELTLEFTALAPEVKP